MTSDLPAELLIALTRALLAAVTTVVVAGLCAITLYLLLLTLAAVLRRPVPPPNGPARRRFAVLIPAHDEEALIGRLLSSLAALDYPRECVDIYVVADNCSDATESVARAHGATVFTRVDHSAQGKGYALVWLLNRVRAEERGHDAYVVLDADSTVSANFLRRMDARLEAGSQVVQAYYAVLNSTASPLAGLRAAALAAVHYLRPLGRAALGLSCGLKGNGMCLVAPVLERYGWRWFTLAEDVEFHLALVRDGVRVDFAPEATVWADMPVTFGQAESQNMRWERGRLRMLLENVPPLVADGLRRRNALSLDAAVEQFMPPLSVPFALGGACFLAALVLDVQPVAWLTAIAVGGQIVYLIASLALVRAPLSTYASLLYAPPYVIWKVGLFARALVSARAGRWIRTARLPAAMPAGVSAGVTAGVAAGVSAGVPGGEPQRVPALSASGSSQPEHNLNCT